MPVIKLKIQESRIMASPRSLVVLHLHTEHLGEMSLSPWRLGSVLLCSPMSEKCLECILLKLIKYTKSKRAEKMLKDVWMLVNDQSTQKLRSVSSYLACEPALIFFLSIFFMAFLCHYNCSANTVAEWKNQNPSWRWHLANIWTSI